MATLRTPYITDSFRGWGSAPRARDRSSPPSPPPVRKVALMIGQLGVGGTEKQVVLLARGLRDRGVDTRVWILYDGTRQPWQDKLREAGIPVVTAGLRQWRGGLAPAGGAAGGAVPGGR